MINRALCLNRPEFHPWWRRVARHAAPSLRRLRFAPPLASRSMSAPAATAPIARPWRSGDLRPRRRTMQPQHDRSMLGDVRQRALQRPPGRVAPWFVGERYQRCGTDRTVFAGSMGSAGSACRKALRCNGLRGRPGGTRKVPPAGAGGSLLVVARIGARQCPKISERHRCRHRRDHGPGSPRTPSRL